MFTRDQIEEIKKKLIMLGTKDTQFPDAHKLNGEEIIAIVQDGENKKIPLSSIINDDFINVSKDTTEILTLSTAVSKIDTNNRKLGQVITFKDSANSWAIRQFTGGSLDNWNDISLWKSISSIDELKSQVETNAEDISVLSDEIERHDASILNLNTDVSRLKDKDIETSSSLSELTTRVDTLKSQADTNTSNISSLNTDVSTLQSKVDENTTSISQINNNIADHEESITQINTKLDEHTESINAKITTDRIEDGAVTSEKIATSAFDSTLSVSGKIAPADVVGEKLNELEEKIAVRVIHKTNFSSPYTAIVGIQKDQEFKLVLSSSETVYNCSVELSPVKSFSTDTLKLFTGTFNENQIYTFKNVYDDKYKYIRIADGKGNTSFLKFVDLYTYDYLETLDESLTQLEDKLNLDIKSINTNIEDVNSRFEICVSTLTNVALFNRLTCKKGIKYKLKYTLDNDVNNLFICVNTAVSATSGSPIFLLGSLTEGVSQKAGEYEILFTVPIDTYYITIQAGNNPTSSKIELYQNSWTAEKEKSENKKIKDELISLIHKEAGTNLFDEVSGRFFIGYIWKINNNFIERIEDTNYTAINLDLSEYLPIEGITISTNVSSGSSGIGTCYVQYTDGSIDTVKLSGIFINSYTITFNAEKKVQSVYININRYDTIVSAKRHLMINRGLTKIAWEPFKLYTVIENITSAPIDDIINNVIPTKITEVKNAITTEESNRKQAIIDEAATRKAADAVLQEQLDNYSPSIEAVKQGVQAAIKEDPSIVSTVPDGSLHKEKFSDELKIQTRIRGHYPEEYGYVRGTDDLGAAINAMIADGRNSGNGKTHIYLTPGTHYLRTPILIKNSFGGFIIGQQTAQSEGNTPIGTKTNIICQGLNGKAAITIVGSSTFCLKNLNILSSSESDTPDVGILICRSEQESNHSTQWSDLDDINITLAARDAANNNHGVVALYNLSGEQFRVDRCTFNAQTCIVNTQSDIYSVAPTLYPNAYLTDVTMTVVEFNTITCGAQKDCIVLDNARSVYFNNIFAYGKVGGTPNLFRLCGTGKIMNIGGTIQIEQTPYSKLFYVDKPSSGILDLIGFNITIYFTTLEAINSIVLSDEAQTEGSVNFIHSNIRIVTLSSNINTKLDLSNYSNVSCYNCLFDINGRTIFPDNTFGFNIGNATSNYKFPININNRIIGTASSTSSLPSTAPSGSICLSENDSDNIAFWIKKGNQWIPISIPSN